MQNLENDNAPGTLYLVATPIGNLGDISVRAERTLRDADFIAAEDTRVTRKLLEHLGIKKPLVSHHAHNLGESGGAVLARLLRGETCALATDAGTPGVSDPGAELVRLCAERGIAVTIIPGPCAAVSALALSGLPSGRFAFEGFLSADTRSRRDRLEELKTEKRTMVFYEAPHKLERTLRDMLEAFGDRSVSISRELTKIHEETLRCTLSEALGHFTQNPPRGEFTLVVEGVPDVAEPAPDLDAAVAAALAHIAGGASMKDAVMIAASETGVAKNALYNAVAAETRMKNEE
jgi:16S rRNA (cytidine1402-2'-O)-methyltransferase